MINSVYNKFVDVTATLYSGYSYGYRFCKIKNKDALPSKFSFFMHLHIFDVSFILTLLDLTLDITMQLLHMID